MVERKEEGSWVYRDGVYSRSGQHLKEGDRKTQKGKVEPFWVRTQPNLISDHRAALG